MIAYLGTSALLRLVLREPGSLEELLSCEAVVSSELLAVESLRAIDRLRLQGALSTDEAATRQLAVTEWLEAVDLVLLKPPSWPEPRILSLRRSARLTRFSSSRPWSGATGRDRSSPWRLIMAASRSPHVRSALGSSAPDSAGSKGDPVATSGAVARRRCAPDKVIDTGRGTS